jgi:hypothetical protein
LWVRAPPNPNILFELESPRSRYGSHSAAGKAQLNEQYHAVVCCSLLLFFRVIPADLAHVTAVWGTFPYFVTLLADSRSCRRRKGTASSSSCHSTSHGNWVCSSDKIALAVGDRIRFTKNVKHHGHKFLYNELRTVVSIDDGKITFDKGEIVRNGAPLHR